jgi:hypothetical protein
MHLLEKVLTLLSISSPKDVGVVCSVLAAYQHATDGHIDELSDEAREALDKVAKDLRDDDDLQTEAKELFVAPLDERHQLIKTLDICLELQQENRLPGHYGALGALCRLLGAMAYKRDLAARQEREVEDAKEKANLDEVRAS